MIGSIVNFIVVYVEKFGYLGIIIMMFLESSFFPFPSEVVIPPAGYLAALGRMNICLVIICGISGSVLGALFNYYLALWLGRRFILKYGRYFGITAEKFEKAEIFLREHGSIGTITGRLVPVIRQYISFPAGLVKMNVTVFSILTGIGSGIWITILAWIGYFTGNNQELVKKHSTTATVILAIVVLSVIIVYIRRKRNV